MKVKDSNYIEYESKGYKNKTLSIKEHLYMIRPYLRDKINYHQTQGQWKVYSSTTIIDYKTQGEWETQLPITIKFIFLKDSDENRIVHTKSNNIEIMMGYETDGIIEKLFESLLQKY